MHTKITGTSGCFMELSLPAGLWQGNCSSKKWGGRKLKEEAGGGICPRKEVGAEIVCNRFNPSSQRRRRNERSETVKIGGQERGQWEKGVEKGDRGWGKLWWKSFQKLTPDSCFKPCGDELQRRLQRKDWNQLLGAGNFLLFLLFSPQFWDLLHWSAFFLEQVKWGEKLTCWNTKISFCFFDGLWFRFF